MQHDPAMAAPLRLIAAGIDLHRPPFAVPPYSSKQPSGAVDLQRQGYTTAAGEGETSPITTLPPL